MLVLASILAYLLVGTAIGRVQFIKIMGDHPRRIESVRPAIERNTPVTESKWEWTDEYQRASFYATMSIFVWPFTLPVFAVQTPTAHERQEEKQLAADKLLADIEKINRQYEKFKELTT